MEENKIYTHDPIQSDQCDGQFLNFIGPVELRKFGTGLRRQQVRNFTTVGIVVRDRDDKESAVAAGQPTSAEPTGNPNVKL